MQVTDEIPVGAPIDLRALFEGAGEAYPFEDEPTPQPEAPPAEDASFIPSPAEPEEASDIPDGAFPEFADLDSFDIGMAAPQDEAAAVYPSSILEHYSLPPEPPSPAAEEIQEIPYVEEPLPEAPTDKAAQPGGSFDNDIMFDLRLRGYDRRQVDEYLDAITEDYNKICARCAELSEENARLQNGIDTLANARELAERIIADARRKAEELSPEGIVWG
ncbi:MAG: DivIVA domain-containing protein [Clostridium sp.]|nr:DivIVA domain-containing protein [Clostridium sp.]